MTLRDFEKKGRLGCIECYNTFNDYIVKEMFKQQGESTYGGRLPAQTAELANLGKAIAAGKSEEAKEKPAVKEEANEAKEPEKAAEIETPANTEDNAALLEKLAKADLGMLSDEELQNGIKLAAENEDYVLASKLRDELKGRKGGN
jgi:protein-arginine kinase activator protein McsA